MFLSCWLFGLRHPALELAGCWEELGLGAEIGPLGKLTPIDITCGQEFSAGPAAWTQHSHHGGSGLTPGQGTKTLQAVWYGKKINKITNKEANKTQEK